MLIQIRTPQAKGEGLAGGRLVDRQARTIRYLRVSLTDRCNLRCTYCMPEEGIAHRPREELLSLEEIVAVCRAFAAWGVERVRLTGGEPTVRRGLVDLVGELAGIRGPGGAPLAVTMTTNGELLGELAGPLARAGLRGVTISLDSLDRGRYATITRRGALERVLAGIDAALAAGLRPLKINTVAIRGFNDHELAPLAAFAWDRGITPRFIEVMPMAGGRLFVPGELMPAAAIREALAAAFGGACEPDDGAGVRGLGPATYWRIAAGPRAGARFGVIAAMTENFCGTCNRLRLSATGQLHACLARDDAGDLRGALRSGDPEALGRAVRRVVGAKEDGHSFALDGSGGPQKAMISIGG